MKNTETTMPTFSQTDLLVAQSFSRLTFRWEEVRRYWKFSLAGLERMKPALENSLVETLAWGARQPGFLKCTPEEFLRICTETGVGKIADDNMSSFRSTLECSCLVFLHAELELALIELFKVISISAPERILPDVPKDKLLEQNARGRLYKACRGFDFGLSLPEKIEKLHEVLGKNFDRNSEAAKELEHFDQIRHDVVHRPGSIAVPGFDTGQETFREWGKQCWMLVLKELRLKMDSEAVKAVMTGEAVADRSATLR